ncbi:MAG: sensory rhodopsin transducer [Bacillota bacterium]
MDKDSIPGKKRWIIPDGFLPEKSNGDFVSHEAICVLNLGEEKASIEITVYFEDREPMENFQAECEPRRTHHIRLDKIKNDQGQKIPRGVPYALDIKSDRSLVAQHSRMDTSQKELGLMSTIPF